MPHPAHVREWADRFAVLGDPGRLRLLLVLHWRGQTSVKDLAELSELSPASVSHALRLLRFAGMVSAERDGRLVLYQIDGDAVAPIMTHIVTVDAAFMAEQGR